MEITDLEFHCLDLPRLAPQGPLRTWLLRLTLDDGTEGWGEAPLHWPAEQLAARREFLLPGLAGRSVFEIEELLRLDFITSPALRCAVEMASWDAIGKLANQPLAHLWGGAYRTHLPLAARLSEPGEASVQRARELFDHGFHTLVVESRDPAQDVEWFKSIREAVGDRCELVFDAARRFTERDALSFCRALEPLRPRGIVDLLAAGSRGQAATIARQTNVPLGLCQAITSPQDVFEFARSVPGGFFTVQPERVGGLQAARKCIAVAEAAGTAVSLAVAASAGIAAAALLHLAASTPTLSAAHECGYPLLLDDVLQDPLLLSDGMLALPRGPGLGVAVDREKLERFQSG